MSCTDVERKITFGIFSSDYERMIANRKQRECNVQADALIRQGWLIKYQGLTCNEKEVVLNSTGSVFESEDEKDFLAAQVNACKEAVAYDAVVQKFSQKTCSELEGLLALRDQSLSYQELRAIKEVFHKNCLASY